ncbi:MAG: AsmA-like C-terminal domain-containing protein, partial [Pseudomonadota bacterium]
ADLDIDEIRLDEEQYFRNVTGWIAQGAGGGVNVRLDAALGEGGPVRFRYKRNPKNGGELRVRARDAGQFLRDAGVFDDGSGGDLLVTGDIAPGEALRIDGRAVVRDIVIHDDAKLEQMLSGADLAALQEEMREDGMVFSSIRAPFVLSDGRIRLSEAIAKGSAIGVSISGDYGLESETLDFEGVFTPAYALNSALGNIPVLGAIFTGGDGQGLFAFNFAVRGNAKDPKVSVNPFSVLAPGIFRTLLTGKSVEDEVEAAFRDDQAENSQR